MITQDRLDKLIEESLNEKSKILDEIKMKKALGGGCCRY